MLNKRARLALITVITFVWAVNFTAPVFEHNYAPPAEINLAFMGVVGILTAGFDKSQKHEPPPDPEPPVKKAPVKKTTAKKVVKKAPAKKTTRSST